MWKKIASFLAACVVLLCLVLVLWNLLETQPVEAVAGPDEASFAGRVIALSDVDQQATAYADGILAPLPLAKDTLSVVQVEDKFARATGRLPVSNSVVGWPQSLAVSSDGRMAYVSEVRGAPSKDIQRVPSVYEGLPTGHLLSAVDISGENPTLVWSESVGENLSSVSLRLDDKMLVLGSQEDGKELVFWLLDDFGVPSRSVKLGLEIPSFDSVRPGIRSVTWHPSGEFLAVNLSDRAVAFYRLHYGEEGLPDSLERLGEPVESGPSLTAGAFHPEGRFYLIPDVGWGTMSKPTDYVFNKKGRLVVIEFSPQGRHKTIGSTQVGRSPEGFALSPSGDRIVTVNMNRTYLPQRLPAMLFPGRELNSLTLLSFDSETGETEVLDEQGFTGLLPEDACFDAEGRNLAVAVFHHRDREREQGFIEFWSVAEDRLQKTSSEVPLARGVHELEWAAAVQAR